MPVADYNCEICGQVWEIEMSPLPPTVTKTHDVEPTRGRCSNDELTRVWGTFGISSGGLGRTPPR